MQEYPRKERGYEWGSHDQIVPNFCDTGKPGPLCSTMTSIKMKATWVFPPLIQWYGLYILKIMFYMETTKSLFTQMKILFLVGDCFSKWKKIKLQKTLISLKAMQTLYNVYHWIEVN